MENGFIVTCQRDVLKRAIWEVRPCEQKCLLLFQIKDRHLLLVCNGKSAEVVCKLKEGGNDCYIGVPYRTTVRVCSTFVTENVTVEFDGTDLKIDNTIINFDKGKKRKPKP